MRTAWASGATCRSAAALPRGAQRCARGPAPCSAAPPFARPPAPIHCAGTLTPRAPTLRDPPLTLPLPPKVYRLIATGTVEEQIYRRQIYKQQHTNQVVYGVDERRHFEGVKVRRRKGPAAAPGQGSLAAKAGAGEGELRGGGWAA